MKNLKLGAKIALGFGLLIILALCLGGLAIYSMTGVAGDSTKLAKEYMPQVNVAVKVQEAANRVMYSMRGYILSQTPAYITQARQELEAMDKSLAEGDKLAARARNLGDLKGELGKIKGARDEFMAAMEQITATVDQLGQLRAKLKQEATTFMESSGGFLAVQNEEFKKQLKSRQSKVHLSTKLLELGTAVRVLTFQAQAAKDAGLIKVAVKMMGGVTKMSDDLKAITNNEIELERIKEIVSSAAEYQKTMRTYVDELDKGELATQDTLETAQQDMETQASVYVSNCNQFLEIQQWKLSKEMTERHDKITRANGLADIANDTQIKVYMSQALDDPEIMRGALANFDKLATDFKDIRNITEQKDELAKIDQVEKAANGYKAAMNSFLEQWGQLRELGVKTQQIGDSMIAVCAALADSGMQSTSAVAGDAMTALNGSSQVLVYGLLAALIIGVLLAVFIARSITKPVHVIINGLGQGSEQVAAASGEVSNASQTLAQGAAEQAASLEETSASLEEMGSMTRQNAENASQADTLSREAKKVVERANQDMVELTHSMEQINEAGEETSKIIKTIDEIAFQTNLLALNAAVEAARAGEAGAGFAVVADEVRNLAMRAAEAAKNTSDLIETTINRTKEGTEIVAKTNQAFQEVAQVSGKVEELVSEIASASKEQAQGIDQVNKAMTEMDKVTQQNAASAEESAAASEELSAQAATMQGFVSGLVNLVGSGGGGGKKTKASKRRLPWGRKAKKSQARQAGRALPPPSPRNQPARQVEQKPAQKAPEEVIPLEKDDFGDF